MKTPRAWHIKIMVDGFRRGEFRYVERDRAGNLVARRPRKKKNASTSTSNN